MVGAWSGGGRAAPGPGGSAGGLERRAGDDKNGRSYSSPYAAEGLIPTSERDLKDHGSGVVWGDVKGHRAYAGTGLPSESKPWPWVPAFRLKPPTGLRARKSKGPRMARRKTARIDLRTLPEKRAAWQSLADARELPLSVWLERVADTEVERVERARLLEEMYPNRPDLRESR